MRSSSASTDLHLVECAHHLSKVTNSGENDFRGIAQRRCIANQFILCANFTQRVLDRA